VITIHQRCRQTDRQTTCDRNTALCTKVHRAVKTGLIICSYFIFILRFEKTQLEKVEGLKGLKALEPKKWRGSRLEPSSLIEVYAYANM